MLGYPLTINKEIIVDNINSSMEEIMNQALIELKEFESITRIDGQTIEILESEGFSSKSTLKNFNKGNIKFIKEGNSIRIKGRMILIEHFVIFLFVCFIATLTLFGDLERYKSLTIVGLLFIISFVYFYLFPYMAFDMYFDILKKRIKEGKN